MADPLARPLTTRKDTSHDHSRRQAVPSSWQQPGPITPASDIRILYRSSSRAHLDIAAVNILFAGWRLSRPVAARPDEFRQLKDGGMVVAVTIRTTISSSTILATPGANGVSAVTQSIRRFASPRVPGSGATRSSRRHGPTSARTTATCGIPAPRRPLPPGSDPRPPGGPPCRGPDDGSAAGATACPGPARRR